MGVDPSAAPVVSLGGYAEGPVALRLVGRFAGQQQDTELPAWAGFAGEYAETCVMAEGDECQLLVGLGPLAELTVERLLEAARSAGDRVARHLPMDESHVDVTTGLAADAAPVVGVVSAVRAVTTGFLLGLALHSGGRRVRVHLTGVVQDAEAAAALAEGKAGAWAMSLVTEMVDARANQLTPTALARRVEAIGSTHGLEVTCLDETALREAGFGALLAVGAGSPEPSCLVRVAYRPGGTGRAPVALVGKGVTFDSGGLSLKSPAAMVGMHSDMAGAAVVLATVAAIAQLRSDVPVVGYLPLAENLPGRGATRPGDVVTSLSGQKIEVVDTDFEGRVLMVDALTLAVRDNPAVLVDVATLTYQAVTALGPEIGALVGRDATLAASLQDAGEQVGEPWWPMPFATRYAAQIRSSAPDADVRNHPGAETGRVITAALFLGEFVPAHVPWAHLDMAGPTLRGSGPDARATGFAVRTLIRYIQQLGTNEAWPPIKTTVE